jgi:hypothetical protein
MLGPRFGTEAKLPPAPAFECATLVRAATPVARVG